MSVDIKTDPACVPAPKSLLEAGFRWALGQQATTVILVLILGQNAYEGYVERTETEPARQAALKDAVVTLAEEHTRSVQTVTDSYEKRYQDQKAVDAERYVWIREGYLMLSKAIDDLQDFVSKLRVNAGLMPKPEPIAGKPKVEPPPN